MSGVLARRSNSTTSLSRFYHEQPDPDQSSSDFCNSFWGLNDCGVEVLFARVRGAARTMEELRGFWRERIAIEEDYAKRLAKLSKLPLGRDEIGDLRQALDTLRVESDKQAAGHLTFAQNMRRELEQPANDFIGKQNNHKKTFQATIEKSYKAKQTQEKYVEKAREKYESDCVLINSYTAQSTLLQGKELDKIYVKLDRAQQTVQGNERDYQNFARALGDTCKRWEGEWKTYCDQCQDLEDERIEFIKDNVWAYANSVSTVCVADDESCERMRVHLEQVEAEKEMENFVREYGTGALIQDPPAFISYKASSPPGRPKTKTANYVRSSIRAPLTRQPAPSQAKQEPPLEPGAAGIGAGGGRSESRASGKFESTPVPPAQQRQPTQPIQAQAASGPLSYQQTGASQASSKPTPAPQASDPKSARNFNGPVGDDKDPIAQALDALKKGGGVTRNGLGSIRSRGGGGVSPQPSIRRGTQAGGSTVAAPEQAAARTTMDYRDLANNIIGAHPSSRPTTPTSPGPQAAMMRPPNAATSPLSELHQQGFPGERRLSINRGNTGQTGPVRSPSPARDGFAGIGAQGRSTSPQPYGAAGSGQQPGNRSMSTTGRPPSSAGNRAASPSHIGIALDASGRVAHDSMADEYARRNTQHYTGQQQPPPGQQQQYQHPSSMYPGGGSYQQPQQTGYQHPQQTGYQQAQQAGYQQPSQQFPQQQPPEGYNGQQSPAPSTNAYPRGYVPSSSVPSGGFQGQGQNGYPQMQRAPSPAVQHAPAPVAAPPQQPQPHSQASTAQSNPPTGQFTDDGSGVLFYVKALYDYNASIPEEFDFQAGDIIAVTATPDDGWWSGVLLDDTRRVPGRTVFPSNFVCLF